MDHSSGAAQFDDAVKAEWDESFFYKLQIDEQIRQSIEQELVEANRDRRRMFDRSQKIAAGFYSVFLVASLAIIFSLSSSEAPEMISVIPFMFVTLTLSVTTAVGLIMFTPMAKFTKLSEMPNAASQISEPLKSFLSKGKTN